MQIEFPCPATAKELTVTASGSYCGSCKKEVIDVSEMDDSELKLFYKSNRHACVSGYEDQFKPANTSYSIRKFAMAVLLVFGTGLFSISNAQVQNEINEISTKVLSDANNNGGFLKIEVTNLSGRKDLYSKVTVVLPNGRKERLERTDDGVYYFELPAYLKGREVVVKSEYNGKAKEQTITIPKNLEPERVYFTHQYKKNRHPRRGKMVVGYF